METMGEESVKDVIDFNRSCKLFRLKHKGHKINKIVKNFEAKTRIQIHSHLHKMKYFLEKQDGILSDPIAKSNFDHFQNFFSLFSYKLEDSEHIQFIEHCQGAKLHVSAMLLNLILSSAIKDNNNNVHLNITPGLVQTTLLDAQFQNYHESVVSSEKM